MPIVKQLTLLSSHYRTKLDSMLADRTKYYESADLKISLEGYCEDAERGAPTVVSAGLGGSVCGGAVL